MRSQRDPFSTEGAAALVALTVYSLLGNTAFAAQPLIVGALVDLMGLSERQAGFVSGAEMAGVAVGMGVLVRYVDRLHRRHLAYAAILIVAGANLASLLAGGFLEILPLRFVNGVGAAMAYSVFLTMAAGTTRPERTFAVANSISIFCTGLLVLVGPYIISLWKLGGLFLGLSAIAVATLAAVPLIPKAKPRLSNAEDPTGISAAAQTRIRFTVGLVLLMMFFLFTGHAAIWSYQERIGLNAGLLPHEIGVLIGTSMMIWGLLGSVTASVLALAIGRVWPQVISLGVSIIAAIALVSTDSPFGFGLACALVAFSWCYGLPYQMGLFAAFDPRGKANVAGSLMTCGGAATGPAIAALILGYGGYKVIAVLAGVCYLVALALVLPAALRLQRS